MESLEEENLARRDQLQKLALEIRKRVFSAKSEDGLVCARVLGTGQIVGLELDPRIYRERDSQKLATTILRTLRKASNGAVRAHMKSLEEITGGEADSFQGLVDSAEKVVEKLFNDAEDIRRS